MAINQAFIKATQEIGISIRVDKDSAPRAKHVTIESKLSPVLEFAKVKNYSAQLSSGASNAGSILSHIHCEDRIEFRGGTHEQLVQNLSGAINMGRYDTAKTKLGQGGILESLAAKTDMIPRRARRMSEHDGEWDRDRRYEITPFHTAARTLTPTRVIDLVCDFSVAFVAKAKSIDAYGALVWAISDLLENSGVHTRITYRMEVDRCAVNTNTTILVTLKEPGEWIAPSLLAAVFQSNFFRRIGFGLICAAAEAAGKPVDSQMGVVKARPNEPIKLGNGQIVIQPKATQGYDAEIEKVVTQAIQHCA